MTDDDGPTTTEVANPDYKDLEQLKKDIVGARSTLESTLRRPATTMSDGSAWTGPTAAKAFTQEITGRADQIPGLVTQLVEAVDTALASTPKTVTRPVRGAI